MSSTNPFDIGTGIALTPPAPQGPPPIAGQFGGWPDSSGNPRFSVISLGNFLLATQMINSDPLHIVGVPGSFRVIGRDNVGGTDPASDLTFKAAEAVFDYGPDGQAVSDTPRIEIQSSFSLYETGAQVAGGLGHSALNVNVADYVSQYFQAFHPNAPMTYALTFAAMGAWLEKWHRFVPAEAASLLSARGYQAQ